MHPVIRILTFFILGAFVAFGGVPQITLGFVLLVVLYAINKFNHMRLCVKMLLRMRWFFLSIIVLYLWFTPNPEAVAVSTSLAPKLDGIVEGLLRVFSLVLIVMAVNYFIAPISRDKLVGAILWLLQPLHWIGFDCRTLALRMALTFNLISTTQELMAQGKSTLTSEKRWREASLALRLQRTGEFTAQFFKLILTEASRMESQTIQLDTIKAPSLYQWSLPMVLVAAFWGVSKWFASVY